jgi:hypothetical protein
MTRIGWRLKKNQIAGPKSTERYRLSLSYLSSSGARQIDVKNIFIDHFHETGTVDSAAADPPQAMPGSIPMSVFLAQTVFNFSTGKIALCDLMMR